jgi:hypothetical protein
VSARALSLSRGALTVSARALSLSRGALIVSAAALSVSRGALIVSARALNLSGCRLTVSARALSLSAAPHRGSLEALGRPAAYGEPPHQGRRCLPLHDLRHSQCAPVTSFDWTRGRATQLHNALESSSGIQSHHA